MPFVQIYAIFCTPYEKGAGLRNYRVLTEYVVLEKKLIDQSSFDSTFSGRRKAPRVVRKDISVYLDKHQLFNLGAPIPVKLVDISARGMQISSSKKLIQNKILRFTLEFVDGKKFSVNAKIVRCEDIFLNLYELSFESEALADKHKQARLNKVRLFEGNKRIHAKFHRLDYGRVEILTSAALDRNSALSLIFYFNNGEELKVFTRVVHQGRSINRHHYGIQFDKVNDALGDHLLATQTDLIFSV